MNEKNKIKILKTDPTPELAEAFKGGKVFEYFYVDMAQPREMFGAGGACVWLGPEPRRKDGKFFVAYEDKIFISEDFDGRNGNFVCGGEEIEVNLFCGYNEEKEQGEF